MKPYKGKLAIFTPFYSYHAYSPYTISLAHTLVVLGRLGVEVDYIAQPADFHVERAVNTALTDLLDSDYTDVLLIDSDESWQADGVARLLACEEDIVGASYRMKNNAGTYVGSLVYEDGVPLGKMQSDGTALLQATRVAAGFMRIKVSALKRWAAAYPDLRVDQTDGRKVTFFTRMTVEEDGKKIVYDQDCAFCQRWLDAGGTLWVDPMVHVDHWWMERHRGDYDKHLRTEVVECGGCAPPAGVVDDPVWHGGTEWHG